MSALIFAACTVAGIAVTGDNQNGGGNYVGANQTESVVFVLPLQPAMQYHVEIDASFNRYVDLRDSDSDGAANSPDTGFQFAARWTGGVSAPALWRVHDRWAVRELDRNDRPGSPPDNGFESPSALLWVEDYMQHVFTGLTGYERTNPGWGFYAPPWTPSPPLSTPNPDTWMSVWLYRSSASFLTLGTAGDHGRIEFVLSADKQAGEVSLPWSPMIRVMKCPYTVTQVLFGNSFEVG